MKRRVLQIVGLIVAVFVVGLFVRHAWEQRSRRIRELGYQAMLKSYSEAFKPGMTRQAVESQLRTKGLAFQQVWGPVGEQTASDPASDLVRIGKESAPWYCSEQNIYIAFQFAGDKPQEASRTYDSDVLKRLTIFRWLEGCL